MTQTEKYKLNLLDGGDRLSPKPLNENMVTLERELIRAAEALDKAVGSGGYNARIAFGSYVGTGENRGGSIQTDFRPVFVQVAAANGDAPVPPFVREAGSVIADLNKGYTVTDTIKLVWDDRSVTWSASENLNVSGKTYFWVAIGYTVQEGEADGEA